MLLKQLSKIWNTLAFRLTLLYAAIFFISTFAALFVVYLLSSSIILKLTDQELANEHVEFASLYKQHGIEAIKNAAKIEAESEGPEKMFYRIFSRSGKELGASDLSTWGDLNPVRTGLYQLDEKDNSKFLSLDIPDRPYGLRIMNANIEPDLILQIGLSLEENAYFIEAFRKIFAVAMIAVLLIAAGAGWLLAKRALVGVEEVTRAAVQISESTLNLRVPIKARGHEIENLAQTFNQMLDRIQALITEIREMTDNIAHDLKSPITRMRGIAELTLNSNASDKSSKSLAANIVEDCDRLLQMINTMLDISEAEAGAARLNSKKTDIAAIIQDAIELFEPSAEEKGLTVSLETPKSCYARVDIQGFQRMVANLLDNAFKYTPSGGTIAIAVKNSESNVDIVIRDTGIGISQEDLSYIFKRLYRCDTSRSQPGFGLGLSLAMAIAKSHSGGITAESSPGKGSTFTITLPLLT
ncbi:MAG: HAMP domain-containing sensor histidine kinase [Desulfobacterales bacterium]|jgi:signal transduction histidine kinase